MNMLEFSVLGCLTNNIQPKAWRLADSDKKCWKNGMSLRYLFLDLKIFDFDFGAVCCKIDAHWSSRMFFIARSRA